MVPQKHATDPFVPQHVLADDWPLLVVGTWFLCCVGWEQQKEGDVEVFFFSFLFRGPLILATRSKESRTSMFVAGRRISRTWRVQI
jgi:hypothetical protein